MTSEELLESFRPKAARGREDPAGTEFFVDRDTAAEMIDASAAHGFAVTGLDDYLYEQEELMVMSYGYNGSRPLWDPEWEEFCRHCNEGARKFLDDAAASGANLFSLVIVGRRRRG